MPFIETSAATRAAHHARSASHSIGSSPSGNGIALALQAINNTAHSSFAVPPETRYAPHPEAVAPPGSSRPPATVNVAMADAITLCNDNATLSTRALSDCSALAVLTDWNGRTYGTRTLMHLTGSNLEFGLVNQDAYRLLAELKDSLADGGKVIWVGGTNSQSDIGLAISLGQQDSSGRQPLLDLLKAPGVSVMIAGASGIDIRADGTCTLAQDCGRGVLNKQAMMNVSDFI